MLLAVDGVAFAAKLAVEPGAFTGADLSVHPRESLVYTDPRKTGFKTSRLAPCKLAAADALADSVLLTVSAPVNSARTRNRGYAQAKNKHNGNDKADYPSHTPSPLFVEPRHRLTLIRRTVEGEWRTLFYRVARNHGVAVASLLKKLISISATFSRADVAGWVPSSLYSEHDHVSPSLRGTSPSAQRYGPHASHGALTSPRAGS